ncbi:MAG: hypothetical protein IJH92_00335 [Mogibacterium sp.]|nr:hypothetical protein [Mogibacterium sp.]
MEKESKAKTLQFYGGWWGVVSGFIVMIIGIIILTATGKAMPMAFWVPTIAGMGVMLILAKNRSQCADAMIEGMSQELVLTIVMALFLGGIFSQLMQATGLVDGLIWLSLKIGLKGAAFCVVTFIAGAMLSTATGTALGTLIALTPILYPVGVAMGASPVAMGGAIISASYFGDNIAPVSDTTIASAVTQGSSVSKAVRARLRYALVAGLIAIVLFMVFGGGGVQTATAAADFSSKGLIMLIVPVILIIMMFRDANLIVAILASVAIGIVIGLVSGLLGPSDILFVDMDSFSVGGIICNGISGMMDSAVFALLVMSIVHIVQETGFLDMLIKKMEGMTKTDTSAEFTIGLISFILSFMTLANTIAIIIEGPMAKQVLVDDHHIGPERSAAILDAVSASAMGLCPYAFAPLLCVVFAAGTGATMDFNAVKVCLFAFYNIALLFVMIFATFSGWGRTKYKDNPEETVPFKQFSE